MINYHKQIQSLPYGQCYLFKGNSNTLIWLLKNEPNLTIVNPDITNNLDSITNQLTFDPTNYILFHQKGSLLEKLFIPKNIRVFITFSIYDTGDSKSKEKYKHYESSTYKVLDYRSTKYKIQKDEVLWKQLDTKARLSVKRRNTPAIPLVYSCRLQLDTADGIDLCDNKVVEYLYSYIQSNRDIKYLWAICGLRKETLNSYFHAPFRGFISSVVSKDKQKVRASWELFYWWKYFYYNCFSNKDLKTKIIIFTNWLHQSSTVYSNNDYRGLSYYSNFKIVLFKPSPLAIRQLKQKE